MKTPPRVFFLNRPLGGGIMVVGAKEPLCDGRRAPRVIFRSDRKQFMHKSFRRLFLCALAAGLLLSTLSAEGAGEFNGEPGAAILAGCGGAILYFDASGAVARRYDENVGNMGDCHLLESGNILYADAVSAKEIAPDGTLLREWTDPDGGSGDFTFSVQRTADGGTVIGSNSSNAILEYDKDDNLLRRIPCAFLDRPGSHDNMRWVRKTARGTYLAAQKSKGVIAEYDAEGRILRKMSVPDHEVYGLAEVPGTGEVYGTFLDCVVKFDAQGNEVWRCTKDDLPSLELTYICSIQIRASGNLVLGNYAANRDGVHAVCMFEITPEKDVVWSYRDAEGPDSFLGVEVAEPAP